MTGEQLYDLFEVLNQRILAPSAEKGRYGSILTILYSDLFTPEETMDIEIGVLLHTERTEPLRIAADIQFSVRDLPAVEQMATIIHQGLDDHPLTYNALGHWLEQHHFSIVGPGREMVLGAYAPDRPETCVMEIAFPVERENAMASDVFSSLH